MPKVASTSRVSHAITLLVAVLPGCDGEAHVPIDAIDANIATGDASMLGLSLWLQADDDPSDGVLDSARGRIGACSPCPTLVPGKIGSAYQFMQHEVTFPETPDLAPRAGFTIAAWVRIDATDANSSTILCKQTSSDFEASYCLGIIPTTFMRLNYYKTGLQGGIGQPTIMLGSWHHVAMTWDGTTVMGYVDGRQDFMETNTTAQAYDTTQPVVIGNNRLGVQNPLKGALDDLRFYVYPLTAAEIAALAAL